MGCVSWVSCHRGVHFMSFCCVVVTNYIYVKYIINIVIIINYFNYYCIWNICSFLVDLKWNVCSFRFVSIVFVPCLWKVEPIFPAQPLYKNLFPVEQNQIPMYPWSLLTNPHIRRDRYE